jgi:hypothetical protein
MSATELMKKVFKKNKSLNSYEKTSLVSNVYLSVLSDFSTDS